MSSDPELLRRYTQESSQEAFAELVRRHIDFVYATALRQAGSDARAEDVTQAVFTDLAKKAAQLATRNDLVGWLHTSTHFASTAIRRSEARREARDQKAQLMNELDHSSTDKTVDWEQLRPVLDEALHALGELDREAILLRYFKQQSFGEIGDTLGLSEEAARKRIDRGVDKLRSLLAKRGITSTLVALELAMASQAAVAAPAGLAATITTAAIATAAQATSFLAQLFAGLKTAAIVASVVAAIFSGGLVVNSANNCRNGETTLAYEKQRLVAQQKLQSQLSNRLTELEKIRSAQQLALAELKATTAARINRISPKSSGEKFLDALLQLDLDAEMNAFMQAFFRCMFSSQYFHGPLLTSLRLSPEQVESFTKICIGDTPSTPGWKFTDAGNGRGSCSYSLKANLKDETVDENALKQLLGDAGFQAYKEHEKTMFIQMLIVNKLASNLVYTDAPLNATTAKQLTKILANASSDPENPSPTDIHWEKVLKEAKTVLTSTQLSALARLSGTLSTSWSYEF